MFYQTIRFQYVLLSFLLLSLNPYAYVIFHRKDTDRNYRSEILQVPITRREPVFSMRFLTLTNLFEDT